VESEAGLRASEIEKRFLQGERTSAAAQTGQQGFENVGGLIANGENLARLLHLGRNAFGLEQVNGLLNAQEGESGVKKATWGPKRFNNPAVIGGMGDVAAGPAGHQDFHARLAVLFQQQSSPPALGSSNGREQAGGTGAYHDHIPYCFRHEFFRP
jgi:hypothetical protein